MKNIVAIIGFCLTFMQVLGTNSSEITSGDWPQICPNIIKKLQWNSRIPHAVEYYMLPVQNVIIHHTVTGECSTEQECTGILQSIQDFHMDTMEFHDIGYNFLIGANGSIYEGAGWHKVGAHTRGYNSKSIGIAFIGNFSDILPNAGMLTALKKFLACGLELGELDKNYRLFGARQVSATASPGTRFYLELKNWPHFTNTPPLTYESSRN